MDKQPNKQIKSYKNFNSWISPFPRHEYSIDIMDMVDLQKYEDQPRYGLAVIDSFSKRAEIEPMKNRDSNSVLQSLLKKFEKNGVPFKYLL